MNRSPFIDPELCRSCGACCKTFEIEYARSMDPIDLSEIDRLRALAEFGDRITTREDGETISLVIDIPCRHLVEEAGRYSCRVYDDPCRPLMCEHFPYGASSLADCPHMRRGHP